MWLYRAPEKSGTWSTGVINRNQGVSFPTGFLNTLSSCATPGAVSGYEGERAREREKEKINELGQINCVEPVAIQFTFPQRAHVFGVQAKPGVAKTVISLLNSSPHGLVLEMCGDFVKLWYWTLSEKYMHISAANWVLVRVWGAAYLKTSNS